MSEKIKFDDVSDAQDSRIPEQPKTQSTPSRADNVPFSVFAKLDLRVGKIISVEEHENADKLFVLKVDLGEGEERTIVAGLRGYYSAEELEGKKAIFVANLEPAVLRGIESNGMILAACSEGDARILIVDGDLGVGSKVS